jgi:hypothetical protein
MPKPWAEVASSPQYQSLNSDQQNAARQQYFSQVVAPQLSTPNDVAAARSQFEQQNGKTRPDFSDVQGSVGPTVAAQSPRSGLTNFADALQHHLMNAPIGIAQLASHGVNAGIQAVAGGTDYAKGVQSRLDAQDQSIQQREADYQQRTPDGAASYGGAAVGEVAPWMTGMGEARALGLLPKVEAAGKLALLQKGGLLAAEGGAMSATQPVTGNGNFALQKAVQIAYGSALAPATVAGLHVGGNLAGSVANAGRYVTQSGRQSLAESKLAQMLMDANADTNALRVPAMVPGYVQSIAQANPSGEMLSLERGLRNDKNGAGIPFVNQDAANNVALRDQAQSVAGTDDALQSAINARRSAAASYRGPNLPETGSPMVDPSQVLEALKQRALSANATVSGAAKDHLSMIQSQSKDGMVPAYLLDDIRQEAGGMLAKHATNGAVGSKVSAKYEPVRSAIADTLDAALPGYRDYLSTHAQLSQPINDMQAGRTLLGAIDSSGRDAGGNQAVNLAPVRSLLAKDARAQYPMSDGAQSQLANLMDTLQQRSVSQNKVAASGPGTAADMADTAQSGILRLLTHGGLIGGGAVTHGTMGAAGGLVASLASEGKRIGDRDIQRRIGQIASNSQLAADALDAYRRKGVNFPSKLLQLMLPYSQKAISSP